MPRIAIKLRRVSESWRLLLIPIFGTVCYCAAVSALGSVVARADPSVAIAAGSSNGIALAIDAENRLLAKRPLQGIGVVEANSIAAIQNEPLNPTALRTLAILAGEAGESVQATKLLSLSERTSRRDFGTQILLIEYAVEQDRITDAIAHYDRVLRVGGDGAAVLLPILTSALKERDVQRALSARFRTNPAWISSFVNFVVSDGRQIKGLGEVIVGSGKLTTSPDLLLAGDRLISALALSGQSILARDVALVLRPELRGALNEPGFSKSTTSGLARPLLWEAVVQSGIGANFERDGLSARIFALSGERGVALRRFLFLKPGKYGIQIRQKPLNSAAGAEHTWSIRCGDVSDPLWSSSQINAVGTIEVAGGCDEQLVELSVAGGTGQSELELLVDGVYLRRR